MKTKINICLLLSLFMSLLVSDSEAQILKKIKKRVSKAVEETIIRKTENKSAQKTSQAMDSVFKTPEKMGGKKKKSKKKKNNKNSSEYEDNIGTSDSEALQIYSKFDFVPGENVLMHDDFTPDNLGDFPSKWDTNGSGELVEVNGEKWLKIYPKATYLPLLPNDLPEEFTLEFDFHAIDVETVANSLSKLKFWLDDNSGFKEGSNLAGVAVSFWFASSPKIRIYNNVKNNRVINNVAEHPELKEALIEPVHVSIAVNKRRLRYWINEKKMVDVPRLIPAATLATFKLSMEYYNGDFLVRNFKLAAGGQDLRSQLLNEGRFSTTGILFDSGSANIKPESLGMLKKIASALTQDVFNINIIGHTDADGDEQQNLLLSQKRATAIKNVLINKFSINEDRIRTMGKGETEPVDINTTEEGKANNRRVEFIKA